VLDRIAAVVLGVVLAPGVAALAGWVRWTDGPPGLLGLTRVGRHGRRFRMWKIRTMSAEHPSGRAGGAALTAGGDLRVTAFGARLRRLRLDEVPQLVNVVRGEMALIGSRPEAVELMDPEDPIWDEVLEVPPGITGATQLVVHEWEERVMAGGGDHVERYRTIVLPVKLAIDRWYVRRGSPVVDATIAWSMVERFALGRATTAIDRLVQREVVEAGAVLRDGDEADPARVVPS
jgi:lipopolysaccharide/colanic/teichoic acid biosynthesis glycosyltransferase